MTRICSRCGNLNHDEVKYCISCGNPLVPQAGRSVPATTPFPGNGSVLKYIAIAAVAIIVIIAVLVFLQVSGTITILPRAEPAVTPVATPTTTSYVITETPPPDTATPVSETTTIITSVVTPTTIKALVCPSDRFACSGECRDLMTDNNNCGGCNVTCTITEICQQGHCTARCADTETSCFDGCHDLRFDAQNCGLCGNACPTGLECNWSVCSPALVTTIPTYIG
jgi:hypothetical protein